MRKLKIFMVTTTFFPNVGGAEYQIKWLAEELSRKGHEVYLFTPYLAKDFIDVADNGFPRNIPIKSKYGGIFDLVKMYSVFTKWVLKIKPDLIHAHFAFSSGFLAISSKILYNLPVIITSYGEDIQVNKAINYGMRLNIFKNILIKISLKLCDRHVLVSNAMRTDAVSSGSSIDKIEIVYNMFMPPKTEITLEDLLRVKEKYDIPLNGKIILSVSRLHAIKGLDNLIKAFSYVSKIYKDVFLVIAGKGEEREKLEKLVKENKLDRKVIFTGFVDERDKIDLIKCCDIFCLPSLEEGLPTTLFEPMYFSRPIVASDIGSIRELLGNCGIFVKAGDVTELAKALTYLLECKNLRKTGKKCCNRIKMFFPNNIIKRYENIYYELLYLGGV